MSLVIRRRALDHPDARLLIDRVQAVYVERYGNPDEDPIDPVRFTPPAGAFFVGYAPDGVPVASGAWRRSDQAALGVSPTAEIKRMYVVEEAQRRGHARRMLAHLEADVADAGIGVIILGTGSRQPEAVELYASSDYVPIPGFGHYAASPEGRFFAKRVA